MFFLTLIIVLTFSHLNAVITESDVYWSPDDRYVYALGDMHQPATSLDERQLHDLRSSLEQIPSDERLHVLIEQPSRLSLISNQYPTVLGSLKERLEASPLPNVTIEDIEVRNAMGAALMFLDKNNNSDLMNGFSLETAGKKCQLKSVTTSNVIDEMRDVRALIDPVQKWADDQAKIRIDEDIKEIDQCIDDQCGLSSNMLLNEYVKKIGPIEKERVSRRLRSCANTLFNLNLCKRIFELKSKENILVIAGNSHTMTLNGYLRLYHVDHAHWKPFDQGPPLSITKPWINPLTKLYCSLKFE